MSFKTAKYIGLRYTTSKRSSGFLSFVSFFATGGMALGVFALIVVLSVMNGFDHELKQRILRTVPHGFLTEKAGLSDWEHLRTELVSHPNVVDASPFIGGNVLISAGAAVKGVQLQGIAPQQEQSVSPVADYFVRGNITDLQEGEFGIVLGRLLAQALNANVGDKLVVTLPQISITLAGAFPRERQFTVVGLFEVGAQVDQQLALIHISDAAKLYRRGEKVDGLRIKFNDLYQAPAGMSQLQNQLGSQYEALDWSQTQGSLFRAVKLEKTVTGVLLSIVVAVAAFNIITSLIMMVTEKKSDIAVLRTMGLTRMGVMMIFITQGSVSALMGIAIGLIVGVPTALFLPEIISFAQSLFGFQVYDPDVYFVSQIPSRWFASDTLVICLVAVISSFVATLYPAYRATLIEPADAMRYDS